MHPYLITLSGKNQCFITHHNIRCQVLCDSRKKLTRTSLQCCYIFWSFGIIKSSIFKCWELSTAKAGARLREGCCTFSLSFKYKLDQTDSTIFMLFCCFNSSEGSLFFQIFQHILWPKIKSWMNNDILLLQKITFKTFECFISDSL
jgi:hypothetical protein